MPHPSGYGVYLTSTTHSIRAENLAHMVSGCAPESVEPVLVPTAGRVSGGLLCHSFRATRSVPPFTTIDIRKIADAYLSGHATKFSKANAWQDICAVNW